MPRTSRPVPVAPKGLSPDCTRFQHIAQVGGIQTGVLDYPGIGGGSGQSCRVAWVNTGSPLRFTVALDRGGDLVEAAFAQHSLAFLTANGYKPPSHAYHVAEDWLTGWPGGLLTSCGPRFIGGPRQEDGVTTSLHGHHSNTPAAVEAVLNPDPAAGKLDMLLALVIRDSRMYGPVIEVRRQIKCTLGVPVIHLVDQVTNRGDEPVAHNWLYHVNTGYPLLDEGARLVYAGKATGGWDDVVKARNPRTARYLEEIKRVPAPLPAHTGTRSRGVLVDPVADRDGLCRVGLVNARLGLGLELEYPVEDLPRLANWQHYGPAGCYVCGIEPYYGSLVGKNNERHRRASTWLEPGQSRQYRLTLRVLTGPEALTSLLRRDGAVKA